MKIRLYGYWRSSSAWRVRIALAVKDVAYENYPVHLVRDGGEQNTEEFQKKNPMGQVPVLEIEEAGETRRLAQSVAIIDYLERRFPEPSLFPEDDYLAGRARQLAEIINSGIQPIQNLRVLLAIDALGGDRAEWARDAIRRGFVALEAETKQHAGRYSIGDRLSIADLFLVPQLYNARRYELDLSPFPTLTRVERACNELPPFAAAHPDRQPDAPKES